jgi:hypothetical protein
MELEHHGYLRKFWAIHTIGRYNSVCKCDATWYINFSQHVNFILHAIDKKLVHTMTNLCSNVHVVRLSPITWLCMLYMCHLDIDDASQL